MKIRALTVTASLALVLLATAACSRHRQEAVKLANQGDGIVEIDPSSAIAKYDQAVKLDPSNHRILYKLAKAYKKKEEWDKVASTLARATELDAAYANYWFERGYALYRRAKDSKKADDYKEAIKPLEECVKIDQNKDECYFIMAICHLWSDDEQKALQNYTKAIEFRPDRIDYYPPLADLYMNLLYYDEAEKVLKAAKSVAKPGDKLMFNVHQLLAKVLREKGDVTAMVTELEAAKALGMEEHPEILFSLGAAYAKLDPPKVADADRMLKGFTKRACVSKKAKQYQVECEQAQTLQSKLKSAGGL